MKGPLCTASAIAIIHSSNIISRWEKRESERAGFVSLAFEAMVLIESIVFPSGFGSALSTALLIAQILTLY